MPSEKRKAKKQNYFKAVKQSRRVQEGKVLTEGLKGFLLTCNNREKETVREGYNLLNEFADKIYGPEKFDNDNDENISNDDLDEDIDSAFEKEKDLLNKVKSNTASNERRFQVVDTGTRNCIFIKTTIDDPERLATEIIDDILKTEIAKARFILRLVPILGTCKAHDKNIEELARTILANIFIENTNLSYAILFKTRNNNRVNRDDAIKCIGSVIRNLPGGSSVDLKSPDISVVVEIVRNVCCIGIAKEYFGRRKKYNLVELIKLESNNDLNCETNKDEDHVDEADAVEATEDDSNGSSKTDDKLKSEESSHENVDI